jgi:transcription-repair coupling factor (superfamily II helicase)
MKDELTDCYGFVPREVENLFEVIRIRNLMKKIKGKKMGYDGNQLFIAFQADSPIDPMKILELTRKKEKGVKLTPDHKLYVKATGLSDQEITEAARRLLEVLKA